MSDPTKWAAFRLWADEEGGDCPRCGVDSVLTSYSECRTCGLSALTGRVIDPETGEEVDA